MINIPVVNQSISIPQGADFFLPLFVYDFSANIVDLTGATVVAKVSDAPNGTHICNIASSIPTGTDGQVQISIAHATTAGLVFFRGWYSVTITLSGGQVVRAFEGIATLSYPAT